MTARTANGAGTQVSSYEMRRCGKSRVDAGKTRPDENAGGVVQMLAGTRSGRDAEMGLDDGRNSGDDDSGSGMRPDKYDWPERHGLEVGSAISSPRGMASVNGGLAHSCPTSE